MTEIQAMSEIQAITVRYLFSVFWIRILIRIHLEVMDPDLDPYWECGSGSGSSSIENYQNNQINMISCLSKRLLYLRRYVF